MGIIKKRGSLLTTGNVPMFGVIVTEASRTLALVVSDFGHQIFRFLGFFFSFVRAFLFGGFTDVALFAHKLFPF
jgi:hypothetical protein